MYAVATFLIVAVITTVFGQLATGALIATGVPPEIAAFQARSAFSGAGFTTTETENVVNHPVRRRIVSTTMFVGSLGTPTLVVTVLVGLVAPGPGSTTERTLVVVSGLTAIVLGLANRPIRRTLVGVGRRYSARRLMPSLSDRHELLLELGDAYEIEAHRIATTPEATARGLRGLEQTRHAGRGRHRVPEADVLEALGGIVVVQAAQPVVAVDFDIDACRRLAHPRGRELPVVSRVQRRGIDHEGRHLVAAAPVVVLRLEDPGRLPPGRELQIVHEAWPMPLAVADA
jgi:hypothetical protein